MTQNDRASYISFAFNSARRSISASIRDASLITLALTSVSRRDARAARGPRNRSG